MASRHEIKCINKTDRTSPYERIRAVGGVNPNGSNWKLTQEEAIEAIEDGKYEFYVNRGGRLAKVVVAKSQWGNKYIKTEADGETPDNLLSLYECQ